MTTAYRRLALLFLLPAALLLTAGTDGRKPPIRRGAPLGSSELVPLSRILASPNDYTGRTITVEGTIKACCTRKGCWMELREGKKGGSVRVTFKDYGFFVPVNSRGMTARAEGVVVVQTLSKDDVDHLESEGATFRRNPDGTADEVSFVASGVELRRK